MSSRHRSLTAVWHGDCLRDGRSELILADAGLALGTVREASSVGSARPAARMLVGGILKPEVAAEHVMRYLLDIR